MLRATRACNLLGIASRAHAHSVVLTKPYRKAELAQRLRDAFAAATVIS